MKDFLGKELAVGDRVVKAKRCGNIAIMESRIVERIVWKDHGVELLFLNGSEGRKNGSSCDPRKVVKLT